MIERAYIHVGGPTGAGKTTFVETLLRGVARWWLAARCVPALFNDILGAHGTKIPITAVVANLNDPKDAGLKKALARVGRAMRRGS